MHNESKDTHLGGTTLVEFNGALLGLPLVRLLIPACIKLNKYSNKQQMLERERLGNAIDRDSDANQNIYI
jgi:hypothetical protein